ncbi:MULTISPECIES: TetR/AcrR family transcriptional regulator [Paenibacillus]|uniref:TetR/AcrR family transcriptional regulator n=1 Tax=Paenibacillus TaxID=44249 RepID=UPI0022B8DE62|nr:TetR/AcrR family transcriptional regulator [Paenibacillus caseinilyticus]MCZ8520186.1 TetR/AcrR family transcriptional regulator [Paenibacillus caseinilyticus]
MARPREFNEEEALAAALDVFWDLGYEAASLTHLTERMGINRPSLYAVFGGKRQLFLRCLALYEETYYDGLRLLITEGGPGVDGIRAVLRHVVEMGRDPKARRGCLFVNTMAELAGRDSELAEDARRFQERLTDLFAGALAAAAAPDQLHADPKVRANARFLTMALAGFSVLLKSGPPPGLLEDAVERTLAAMTE